MNSLVLNARFALRTFRKHGGAYVFAMAVLAMGIGISTAVFSLVQAVLLRPLPFPKQDSIRVIWKADAKAGAPFVELAYPELRDLQENVQAFESVAVMPTTLYGYGKVIQTGSHDPVQVESAPVSHDFFRTLGVAPMLGRDFSSDDEHVGAAPVTILSNGVWRREFNADGQIIGRQIKLNGVGCTVIGVMAPDVDFPRGVGLWAPLDVDAALEKRGASFLQAIARVRPGYSDDQVEAQVNGLFRRLAQQYPEVYTPAQLGVVTSLPKYWTGSARPQLLISLGASLLLLLTGCITASNLFLSMTLGRGQEIATRISLGASSSQVFAQFAAEGVIAALLAGTAGLALAWALIGMLASFAPDEMPRMASAALGGDVILFAAALTLLTIFACSMPPTLMASRSNLNAWLRDGSARLAGTRRGSRMQGLFTIAQTAITVVLLAASLLIVITVHSMLTADIGFANRNVVTMNLAIRGPQANAKSKDLFYTHLLDRLRESPAVTSAAGVLLRPMEGAIGWDVPYQAEFDVSKRPEELPESNFEVVTPGYFQTVGTPLLEGRDFTSEDKKEAPHVAVISRSLANRFRRAGHNPIGARIRFGRRSGDDWWQIAGVVGDTRQRGVRTVREDIYVPYLQTNIPVNYLVIRGRGTVNELTDLVHREVARLDPTQAAANVATIAQLFERNTARERFNMILLLTFGAGALLLAAAGAASVVAESVSARKREIAIRIALGADRPRLIGKLIGATLQFVLVGELAGLYAAIVLGRSAPELVYSITPGDPRVLGSVLIFLLAVSVAAAFVPAWIATKLEPRAVLQGD